MQMKQMKRKGMSLLEVIISIALYAVLALLLTEIMTVVNSTMRSTEQLNNRLAFEAKYADNLLTADADGNAFSRLTEKVGGVDVPAVKVSIQYDVTRDPVTNVPTVNKVLDTHRVAGTDELLRASEYTANYNEPSNGTHFHDDTNYRFMTFDKVSLGKSTKPSGAFPVYLWMMTDEAPDIHTIVVTGNFADGTVSKTFTNAANGPFTNGFRLAFNMANSANAAGGSADDDLTITMYKSSYTTAGGVTLTLDMTKGQAYAQGDVKYLLADQSGSGPDAVTNFYTRYDVFYRGNQIFGAPTEAEKNANGIPLEPINFGP